ESRRRLLRCMSPEVARSRRSAARHLRLLSEVKRTCRSEALMTGFDPLADISQPLLDHLVGAGEQRGWHVEAERLGGLEIHDELEFSRRLNREVLWSRPVQDSADVACRASNHIGQISAVADETTGLCKFPREVHSGQLVLGSKINDRSVLVQE